MAAWAGFSDDELRRVKNLANKNPRDAAKSPGSSCKTFDSPSTANIQPKFIIKQMQAPSHKIPKEKMAEYTIVETPLENVDIKLEPVETQPEVLEELDKEAAMNREIKSLEKFREQQKAIEEANKQKKALLAKTLTERKQRAKKEAHKLEHIQKELSRLDNLLTADVQVIRGKIEDASREYMDAQKRFEKAESEYIAAKMDLHNKSELKEQLTEHLYTIIHQNEVRKAKKLADLMKELDMENGENDDLELPQLPPLTTFQPPQMLLSPTGSKSPPGISKFKIVEDVIIPGDEKSLPTVESEKDSGDKSNKNVVEPFGLSSVQSEAVDADNDGDKEIKGDKTKVKDEQTDEIQPQEVKQPDDKCVVKDVNTDKNATSSCDSVDVSNNTKKSPQRTTDECTGNEVVSDSTGSVNVLKECVDTDVNHSTDTSGKVTPKSKWEFDGTLS